MITYDLRQQIYKLVTDLRQDNVIPADLPIPSFTLAPPPSNITGDLATNLPLLLAQKLRTNPRNIAELMVSRYLKEPNQLGEPVFSPPGFINFNLNVEILFKELVYTLRSPKHYGSECPAVKEFLPIQKILVEFVSANPTGPLHIGHGRGAVIGDVLVRILRYLKYPVTTEYYINDSGTQINVLGNSLKYRVLELVHSKITAEEKEWFIQTGYKGDYLVELANEWVKTKNWSTETEIRQTNDTEFKVYTQTAILQHINQELKDFNVNFDVWYPESELYQQGIVAETITELRKNQTLYDKDGALWFKSTLYGDEKDRVIQRSDGNYTYLAADIAYHKVKYIRGYKYLINVWGADHHGYINRLKGAIQSLGYPAESLNIILCQLVRLLRAGKPVKMSTRAGEFVTLSEVIKEVGTDATRYFLLTRTPDAQLDFDLDLAKQQVPENPVFYIQYAHTRICGVYRELVKKGLFSELVSINTAEVPDFVIPEKWIDKINFQLLNDTASRNLIIKVAGFPDVLTVCVQNLSPHYLTAYLLDLATKLHKFYDTNRILTDQTELTVARLSLITAVGIVIRIGLSLLGISTPCRM